MGSYDAETSCEVFLLSSLLNNYNYVKYLKSDFFFQEVGWMDGWICGGWLLL